MVFLSHLVQLNLLLAHDQLDTVFCLGGVVEDGACLVQLDLIHLLDLLGLTAPFALQCAQLHAQLFVLSLQEADTLNVAGESVVQLAQLLLLFLAGIPGKYKKICWLFNQELFRELSKTNSNNQISIFLCVSFY